MSAPAAVAGGVVLAFVYVGVLFAMVAGLCRAAAASRRVDDQAEQGLTKDEARRMLDNFTGDPAPVDPVDAELARLVADTDLEAVVKATRCDCPRCTARRRRVTP